MKSFVQERKRIVIKVGSNVLTRSDGKLDITRMSSLVDQIAWLHQNGLDVILVSSGAMAGGRGLMKAGKNLDKVEQRQLYSAIGQAKLISLYYDLFREHRIHIGQVLTMKESFSTRREYLNQRIRDHGYEIHVTVFECLGNAERDRENDQSHHIVQRNDRKEYLRERSLRLVLLDYHQCRSGSRSRSHRA